MEHVIADLLDQFERGGMTRRQLIQRLALAAAATPAAGGTPAAAAVAGFRCVAVNHISYQVSDYATTRDFYAGLLGMKVTDDDGKSQARLHFGADGYIIARNARQPGTAPRIDHVAYTIENWDKAAVRVELERRGLDPRPDTDLSFHVKDPDGYDVQIAGRE